MVADADEKAAVARAAAMGDSLKAATASDDAEGLAAKESVAAFAAKMAELDALLEDSDAEPPAPELAAPQPGQEERVETNLARLESETAWESRNVGLEVQKPYSRLLLSGAKTVETRGYPLPAALLGRQLSLLETQEGAAGTSALGNQVAAEDPAVRVAGTVTFGSCFAYASHSEWLADETRHLVPPDSPYAWTKDRVVFAWVVESVALHELPTAAPALSRRMRSFFEMGA